MRAAPAQWVEGNAHEHTGSAEALRHSLRKGVNGLEKTRQINAMVLKCPHLCRDPRRGLISCAYLRCPQRHRHYVHLSQLRRVACISHDPTSQGRALMRSNLSCVFDARTGQTRITERPWRPAHTSRRSSRGGLPTYPWKLAYPTAHVSDTSVTFDAGSGDW